ncbi:MAG TPA: response regulator [Candidatus Methylomirabilis sp.]|nr:response regulator [Candidatus Methylomirabilis sp.]
MAVPKNILLVDAYPSSRQGLKDSLCGEGCSVETVGDSWQAIKKMKESHYAVAIIDLDLPPVHGVAMSGWDLVRIFRAFDPGITLILVGADASRDVRALAEKVKVSEFLEKPISPRQLKAIVKKIDP